MINTDLADVGVAMETKYFGMRNLRQALDVLDVVVERALKIRR